MTRLSVTGAEHVAVRNYLFERPGVYANKPGPLRDSRLAFSPNRVSRYRFCGSPGYSRSQTRRNYVGDQPQRASRTSQEDRLKNLEERADAAEKAASAVTTEKDYITHIQKQSESYY